MRRFLIAVVLSALCGASFSLTASTLQNRPFANVMLAADANGALAVTSGGACGTLGPLTPGSNVLVSATALGELQVCGDIGGGGSGDITSVVAGAGLTGGATSGAATLDVGEGLAIDAAADAIAFDPTELVGNISWSTGAADASIAWTFNLSSGTDPIITAGDNAFTLSPTSLNLGTAGVRISQDADGAITLLGLGNGSDEDITLNLDDTSNEIIVSSSTGVAIFDFGTIDVEVPCTAYNATTWNGAETVPCMDAIRDVLETFVTITDSNDGDHLLFLDDSAGTVVKANQDAESFTFNTTTLNVVRRYDYKAAICQNATASLGFSTPVSNPATAACVTGTNTQFGVAQFTNANDLSVQDHFRLPAVFNSLDVQIKWRTSATSGDVVWQIQTICVADAETSDPAFNTASTVTDTAKGTTLQQNDASITSVTVTGCAANEQLFWKLHRDQAHASDTLAATADLIGLAFLVR